MPSTTPPKTSSLKLTLSKAGIAVLALLGLQGCALTLLDWATPTEGYQLTSNIAYAAGRRQRLDIYQPKQTNHQNITILFFYGGSWEGGNKEDYRFVAQALAQQGYQIVIPDYRVYPDALFPDFMDDAARALHWTSANTDQNIVLMGHSAGAHIAALLALDKQYSQRFSINPKRITGLVGLSGPYDFLPIKSSTLKKIFGAANDIQHTQPINYVSAAAPATLLIHGSEDNIVKPSNSSNLAHQLTKNNVPVILKTYPDTGHAMSVGALSSTLRKQLPVLKDITSFLSSLSLK